MLNASRRDWTIACELARWNRRRAQHAIRAMACSVRCEMACTIGARIRRRRLSTAAASFGDDKPQDRSPIPVSRRLWTAENRRVEPVSLVFVLRFRRISGIRNPRYPNTPIFD